MNKFRAQIGASRRIDVRDGYHLTPIAYGDAPSLVKHLNDKSFYDYTCSIPFPYTIADANAFVANVVAFEKKNKVQRDWAIRNGEGEQIGGIGLLFSHGIRSHRSELGYWIGKSYWSLGIMTEVVDTFSNHIFNNSRIIRLEALVFDGNQASIRVLEKAGFTHEGFLQKAFLKDKKYIDAHLYS
ncbi:MAG: GNAT family N-acetyltransferase, partial [Saprospiraceae bacterium]|nr:GNAT family N-acetyltransferase [Saprospiraceae bacterium]